LVPDFVRVTAGHVDVLPIRYTNGTWQTSPSVQTTLSPSVAPEDTQLRDVNGDGLADLVVRFQSTLTVWHGLGGGHFEARGLTRPFRFPNGTAATIGASRLEWVDANKDGLSDVLVVGASSLELFVNNGTSF